MEVNEKVKKALELFKRSDNAMQATALYATGFKGVPDEKSLLAHFDTLDLMDQLDNFIDELEWDIESRDES